MPATVKAPLGASTKADKWYLDINTGTSAAPVWVGVFGIVEGKPTNSPTWKDTTDWDSDGDKSSTVTAREWGFEGKVSRKVTAADPTAYDPGQEALRIKSDSKGVANSIEIRFYEMEPDGPRVEAYRGFVGVEWNPDGGTAEDTDSVSFVLKGQGKRTAIAHPDAGAAAAPSVTSLAPSSASTTGGDLVILTGSGFTGATAVTVDAASVPVADWEVTSDSKIALKAPAHAAGAVQVTVTTATGTSATGAGSELTYA